jgi:hypothetical protein
MRLWVDGRKLRRLGVESGAAVLLCAIASVPHARAQVGMVGGPPDIEPPAVQTGRPDVFVNSGRAEDAMVAGSWLIYPTAFVGGVFDTNPNQLGTHAQSSGGLRVTPSLLAQTANDISKTTIYGVADSQLYTNQSSADAVSVSSGILETYQPLEDLTITGQGDYTRQKDLFSTLGDTHYVQNLNPTGFGLSPVTNPIAYNQLTAAGSVQKNFANAFAIVSGSVVGQLYDQDTFATNQSRNNVTYTGTLRGGLWLTPALYGYLEGSGDSRALSASGLSSSGYRAVGGFGTDQIGLVRGELYGGYQAEDYQNSILGTVGSPVFGARGYYYPLPELTLNLSVDEQLGASLLATVPTSSVGTATRVTTVLGTARYSLAPEWSASSRAGYIHTGYIDNPRRDDAWTAGGTIVYQLVRNIGLTADYQHIQLSSNAALQSFSRDIFTLGLTFKY